MRSILTGKTLERSCLKNVASGRQPGKDGAQKPEHTRQYVRISSTARPRITHAQQFLRQLLFLWAVLPFSLQAGQIDTRTYTLLSVGMPESEVIARAGPPDEVTEEGFVGTPGGGLLHIRKLHYIPGPEEQDPYLTVVTVVSGTVSHLERTIMTHRPHRFPQRPPNEPPLEPAPAEKTPSAIQEYKAIREGLMDKARKAPEAQDVPQKVYKWIDKKGDIHFSDTQPEKRE